MNYSIEHIDNWFGVELPDWIRFFDCRTCESLNCRQEESQLYQKTPEGNTLWSSERAAYDLGIYPHVASMLSCDPGYDLRKSEKEVIRALKGAIEKVVEFKKEYKEAFEKGMSDDGGSVIYDPMAICISNFGWSIIADRRSFMVRAFKG